MKVKKDGNHYELLEPIKKININDLLKWLEGIEEDDCFVTLEGTSYHFTSRDSRRGFVLGIDLMFGYFDYDKSDETGMLELRAKLRKSRSDLKYVTARLKKAKDDIEMLMEENRFLRRELRAPK